ncbi:unnamed protein product [Pedinophyceae sp. YPF-701]|nr:unnamed protein product [Pedinophyceae sp. YPF-701]
MMPVKSAVAHTPRFAAPAPTQAALCTSSGPVQRRAALDPAHRLQPLRVAVLRQPATTLHAAAPPSAIAGAAAAVSADDGNTPLPLDFHPAPLRPAQWAATAAAGVLTTVLVFAATQALAAAVAPTVPPPPPWLPAFLVTVARALAAAAPPTLSGLAGCGAVILAWDSFLESQFKALEVTPRELQRRGFLGEGAGLLACRGARRAGPTFDVRYIRTAPAGGASRRRVHCLHGFGASAGSWALCQQGLADALGAVVTAHDMPGFGLTERPASLRDYTSDSNASIIMDIVNAVDRPESGGAAESVPGGPEVGKRLGDSGREDSASSVANDDPDASVRNSPTRSGRDGPSGGAVLMGHSLGALSVSEALISNPRAVSAVVLIAPALLAPPGGPVPAPGGIFAALFALFRSIAGYITATFIALATPFSVIALRRLVRNRSFWEAGLKRAWYWPAAKGTAREAGLLSLIDDYRIPQITRGWDYGLLKFVRSRIGGGSAGPLAVTRGVREALRPTLVRLGRVLRETGVPVLIVHGAQDTLVPLSNSKRLAEQIPGARLMEFDKCGHTPHEEYPEEFVAAVREWLEEAEARRG